MKLLHSRKRQIMAALLIGIFCCQTWYQFNAVMCCEGEIQGLYLSTDDAYSNFMNADNLTSPKTFHKTDNFSINFQVVYVATPGTERYYWVQVYNPSGYVVDDHTFKANSPVETVVNLTNIYLDPAEYEFEGQYQAHISILEQYSTGWITIIGTEQVSFTLEREILDISAYYFDEIYLETLENPYYHNIVISGRVFEAGEHNNVENMSVDIFWREPGGDMGLVGTYITDKDGIVNTTISRQNTLNQGDMRLLISTTGDDIYAPAASDQKSPVWADQETNQHVIKNVGVSEGSIDTWTDGSPRALQLTNIDGHIYSPNGSDADIENYDFSFDPFASLNTYGFSTGTEDYDGFDWQILREDEVTNDTLRYPAITPLDYNLEESFVPVIIQSQAGSIQADGNYTALNLNDSASINAEFEETILDLQFAFFVADMPLEQLMSVSFCIDIEFLQITNLSKLQLSYFDVLNKEHIFTYSDLNNAETFGLNKEIGLSRADAQNGFFILRFLAASDTSSVQSLFLDQVCLTCSFQKDASRDLYWDAEYHTVNFAAIGGSANTTDPDATQIYFGTEVKIPDIPYYALTSLETSITFDLSYSQRFQEPDANFSLLLQCMPGEPVKELTLAKLNDTEIQYSHFTRTINLTQASLNQIQEGGVFYFSLCLATSELVRGDQITVILRSINMTGSFTIESSSSTSNIEDFFVKPSSNSVTLAPSGLEIDYNQEEVSQVQIINSSVPYAVGERFYNASLVENSEIFGTLHENAGRLELQTASYSSYIQGNPIVVNPQYPFDLTLDIDDGSTNTTGGESYQITYNQTIMQQNFIYLGNDSSCGQEITIRNNSVQWQTIELDNESTCLISAPINQNSRAIVSSLLHLVFAANQSQSGNYTLFWQRVVTPVEWTDTYLQDDYFHMEETSSLKMGLQYASTISVTGEEDQEFTFDISDDYISAVQECENEITFLLTIESNDLSNGTKTIRSRDLSFEQNTSQGNLSLNWLSVEHYGSADLLFTFLDPSYLTTSQKLEIIYGTSGCDLEAFYLDANLTYTSLGQLPTASGTSSWIININQSQVLFDKFYLLLHPIFSPDGTQKPTFFIDYISLTHERFFATFEVCIPATGTQPYSLIINRSVFSENITTGRIVLEKNGQLIPIIGLNIAEFPTLFTLDLAREWGTLENSTIKYRFIVEFSANASVSLLLNQFGVKVQKIQLETVLAEGYSGNVYFDFDSKVQLDQLIFNWTNNNFEGNLEVGISWLTELDLNTAPEEYYTFNARLGNSQVDTIDFRGQNVTARYLFIQYILHVNAPATIGPSLISVGVNATRKIFGDNSSLQKFSDGDELLINLKENTSFSFNVTFTVDPNYVLSQVLIASADYVKMQGYEGLAVLALTDYQVSIFNKSYQWEALSFEKRTSDIIDANCIENIQNYIQDDGTIKLQYVYLTSRFMTAYIDYVGLIYSKEFISLLNTSYYNHLNLPRASTILDIYPNSTVQIAESMGIDTSNLPVNYNELIDPATGKPISVEITRTLTQFATGDFDSFTPMNSIENSTTMEDLLVVQKKSYPQFNHISGIFLPCVDRTYSFEFPIDVGDVTPGIYDVQVDLSTNFERQWGFFFFGIWKQGNDGNCYTGVSLPGYPQPTDQDWKKGVNSVKGAVTVQQGAEGHNYFNVICWGKYGYIGMEASLLFLGLGVRMQMSVRETTVKLQKSQETFTITNTLSAEIPIQYTGQKENLRGVLLNGSVVYNASETGSFQQTTLIGGEPYYAYKVKMPTGVQAISQTDASLWSLINFTKSSSQNAPSDNQANDSIFFGPHPRIYTIPLGQNEESFISNEFIYTNEQGQLCVKIFMEVTYTRPSVTLSQVSYTGSDLDHRMDLILKIAAENLVAIPLLSNTSFGDNPGEKNAILNTQTQVFDFGTIFEIDAAELQTAEYSVIAEDAWFFATHIGFSITPQWSNMPNIMNTFGGTLYYSVSIAMQKRLSTGVQYVNFDAGQFNHFIPIILETSETAVQEDYQIILAQSEDRASMTDPNALRLDSLDISDYIIDGKMRYKVLIYVAFDNVSTFDRQFNGPNFLDIHKQIKVTLEAYTTVDQFLYPQKTDEFEEFTSIVPISQPNNPALSGKVSSMEIDIEGFIQLHSAELFHFETLGMGVRLLIDTPEGGRETLAAYYLNASPYYEIRDTLFVPYSKLQGLTSVPLTLQVGYWNGRFIGLYDDVGILEVQLTALSYEFLYSTGFTDKTAGQAYVDQIIDFNFGGPLSGNATSIVVGLDVDSVIQGLVEKDGQLLERTSLVQPGIAIYNWTAENFVVMNVFALGGTQFQFVVDRSFCDLDDFYYEGKVKVLIFLDGRSMLESDAYRDTMYIARLSINHIECAVAEVSGHAQWGTSSRVKPTGDIVFNNPWHVPACDFREKLLLLETIPTGTFNIKTAVNFVTGSSTGLYPSKLAVFGASGPLNFTVKYTAIVGCLVTNANLTITIPESSLFHFNQTAKGIYLYWNAANVNISISNFTQSWTLFNGSVVAGEVELRAGYLPYTTEASPEIYALWNLDFSLYNLSATVGGTIDQPLLFDVEQSLSYPLTTLTSFEIHLSVITEQDLSWEIGFYHLNPETQQFVYYAIPAFYAQVVYFNMTHARYYILPFALEDFWVAYSNNGQILTRLRAWSPNGEAVSLQLNLVEMKLKYNEVPDMLEHQSYINYMIDDSIVDTVKLWDSFDNCYLNEEYLGEVSEFNVVSGALTKQSDLTSSSYIFVNDTYDAGAYYSGFQFNIQNTREDYKKVAWLVNAKYYYYFGEKIAGLQFRIHAAESESSNCNQMEIWRQIMYQGAWYLQTVVSLPMSVHVGQWYELMTFVNGSHLEFWLNGTHFYTGTWSVNNNKGYFGFIADCDYEFLVDNLIISDTFVNLTTLGDCFATVQVQMPAGNELRYGDNVNVTISPVPSYTGSLAGQKVNFMVNSTDGWLYLAEKLTDECGRVTIPVDNVDLYTQNVLGDWYSQNRQFELISNTTVIYAHDQFNGAYQTSWTSNHLSYFSVANGYLEKTGSDGDHYLLTAPANLPLNYSFSFQVFMNSYSDAEKFEWIVDSDSSFLYGYMYRLYSATSSENPNTLQLYKLTYGVWNLIEETPIIDGIYVSQWHDVRFDMKQDSNYVYHLVYLNDELIYQRTTPVSNYVHRPYLGFRIYGTGQCLYDNFVISTGQEEWREITFNPVIPNENCTQERYENVKFATDGITRVEDLTVVTKPFDWQGNNSLSLQVNMSFPFLRNEFGTGFHLDEYYGIRVGVLLPYDEIAQSVTVYLLDVQGNRHDVVLEGPALTRLYNQANTNAVFINGTRLLHAFVDVSLSSTWLGKLSMISLLGVEFERKTYHLGKFEGEFLENAIGLSSLQFIRQLNNFTYNNYFLTEPKTQIAIWCQSMNELLSSVQIFDSIYFRRIPVTLEVCNPQTTYQIAYGASLPLQMNLEYAENKCIPIVTLNYPSAFLLLVNQDGKQVYGGIETSTGALTLYQEFREFPVEFQTFMHAGAYSNASVLWFGNGLFQGTQGSLPAPLEVIAGNTSVEITTGNRGVDYGYATSLDGFVRDYTGSYLVDEESLAYNEDFTNGPRGTYSAPSGINVTTTENLTFTGTFHSGDIGSIEEWNLTNKVYETPFINLLKFRYWTSSPDIQFRVALTYYIPSVGEWSQTRSFTPSGLQEWVTTSVDTQLEEGLPMGATGPAQITSFVISINATATRNATIVFDDIRLVHSPVVYLQVRKSDFSNWFNLTITPVTLDSSYQSKFALPLFVKGQQFVLNNPYIPSYNATSFNGELDAGDYQVRVWFAGCERYYAPSEATTFLRIDPIKTAIYYVRDNFTGSTPDGYDSSRSYNSTTVFALEAGKPFTLLDIGQTWGDSKNLTFLLSREGDGENGIAGKPVWFQVGITPNTLHGLKGRDYFADYYPVVRNIVTGKLIEQPYVVQDKYSRPVLYDYYNRATQEINFYGPYLWMVGLTDENGRVSFPLDFGPSLLEDLQSIFDGYGISDVDQDLYIRVFFSNNFNWFTMMLPTGDAKTGATYLCTASENTRNSTHIYDLTDAHEWSARFGDMVYYDGVYASSYAEGILDFRCEDLRLTGEYIEVTNTDAQGNEIPLLAYASEFSTQPSGQEVDEMLILNEFNRLGDVYAYFAIMDPITNEPIYGASADTVQLLHPNPADGRIYYSLDSSIIEDLVPGYYNVFVNIPASGHYQAASTTYRMLLKSQYTYEFTTPTTLVDFNYAMDEQAQPFYNQSGKIYWDMEEDFVYPKLVGSVWLEADPDPSIVSDGVGVTTYLNNYPFFEEVIYPAEGPVPFEMSLQYFLNETLLFNISTWIDEDLTGNEAEYPYVGNNLADWVHVNASIVVPTESLPINGTTAFDIIGQFSSLETHTANTYGADNLTRMVQVDQDSIPYGASYSTPGLLVYPRNDATAPTSVAITLPQNYSKPAHTNLDTNANTSDYEDLQGGFVIPERDFSTSIRHAYIKNPTADPQTGFAAGAIMMEAQPSWMGLNYLGTYCPFEGKFGALLYVPNLSAGDSGIKYQVLVNEEVLLEGILGGPSGMQYQFINVSLPAEVYSSEQNITLQICRASPSDSKHYQVFWINANLSGYEDLLYVGTRLPFGKTALFSSNFLYYYISSASDVGLDSEVAMPIWMRVENVPGQVGVTPEDPAHYNLAPNMLQIYDEATASEFASEVYRRSSNRNYKNTVTFQPNLGVFIRNQFIGVEGITSPEVHAGYYSIYADDACTSLLGRRKVTAVINPWSWTTNPIHTRLEWSGSGARYYAPFIDPHLLSNNAIQTVARISYEQEAYAEDRVYANWTYARYSQYWNLTGDSSNMSTNVECDYGYNELVYTIANYSAIQLPVDYVMDFYPAGGNSDSWTAFRELIVNYAVNNSDLVDAFQVELVGQNGTLLAPAWSFAIEDNSTRNYAIDLAGIPRDAVVRVNLACVVNQSKLINETQSVLAMSYGLALTGPATAASLGVRYANGTTILSNPLPRTYFDLVVPFEVALPSPGEIEEIYLEGTAGANLALYDIAICETRNETGYAYMEGIWQYSFDPNTARLQNINRFIAGEPLAGEGWVAGSGVTATQEMDSTLQYRYVDYTYDGRYDLVEFWQEEAGGTIGDGVSDFYAMDAQNDGTFETIYTRDTQVTAKVVDAENPADVVYQYTATESASQVVESAYGQLTVTEEKAVTRTKYQGKWSPEIRTRTVSLSEGQNSRPFYFYQERDEWRLKDGEDDYEYHYMAQWNETKGDYDVEEWNDWAVTIDVLYLGETPEVEYNVTGILDRGVHTIVMDPVAPVDQKELNGTILWLCSYAEGQAIAPFYDVGLVLLNDSWVCSWSEYTFVTPRHVDIQGYSVDLASFLQPGRGLCVGIILDTNRDHVWQREVPNSGAGGLLDDQYADNYVPIWEVSEYGRTILRHMAGDKAWENWFNAKCTWNFLYTTIITVFTTVILTWFFQQILGMSWLSCIISSLIASLIMQYIVGPFLSFLMDPVNYTKGIQAKENTNLLMRTRVPAPAGYGGARLEGNLVSPQSVFSSYKAWYQGYRVAVQGSFAASAGMNPALKQAEGRVPVPAEMWVVHPDIPDCIDMGDFGTWLWQNLLNPVGAIITLVQLAISSSSERDNPGSYKAAQAAAYDYQRAALSSAYEAALGLPAGARVVVYPMRVNGEPMYLASVDDTTKTGLSNYWNFTHPAVRVADLAMRTYAARYQNYMALDIRVFAFDQLIMAAQMFFQMTLSMGVLGRFGRNFGKTLGAEMFSEIFIEEYALHSAGDLFDAALVTWGWTPEGLPVIPNLFAGGGEQMSWGDVFEWTYVFAHGRVEAQHKKYDYIAKQLGLDSKAFKIAAPDLSARALAKLLVKARGDLKVFGQQLGAHYQLSAADIAHLSRVAFSGFVTASGVAKSDAELAKICNDATAGFLRDDLYLASGEILSKLRAAMSSKGAHPFLGDNHCWRLKITGDQGEVDIDQNSFELISKLPFLLFLKQLGIGTLKSIEFIDPAIDLKPSEFTQEAFEVTKGKPTSIPEGKKAYSKVTAESWSYRSGPGKRLGVGTELETSDMTVQGTQNVNLVDYLIDLEIIKDQNDLKEDSNKQHNLLTKEICEKLYDVGIRYPNELLYLAKHGITDTNLIRVLSANNRLSFFFELDKVAESERDASGNVKPYEQWSASNQKAVARKAYYLLISLCEIGGVNHLRNQVQRQITDIVTHPSFGRSLNLDALVFFIEGAIGKVALVEGKWDKTADAFISRVFGTGEHCPGPEILRYAPASLADEAIISSSTENIQGLREWVGSSNLRIGEFEALLKEVYHLTVEEQQLRDFARGNRDTITGTFTPPDGVPVPDFKLTFYGTRSQMQLLATCADYFEHLAPSLAGRLVPYIAAIFNNM